MIYRLFLRSSAKDRCASTLPVADARPKEMRKYTESSGRLTVR